MPRVQVTARLDSSQLKRARKALRARTTTETLQRALDLVTEKVAHDEVIQEYSGVGSPNAFEED
jgi:hypothetical protein